MNIANNITRLQGFLKRDESQMRYLSQAVQLEEAVNPHIIRATMSIISLAILVFLIWAAFTSISEIARTSGEVVPQGYEQKVQHLEGGMVKNIHVQEGQIVRKGDLLITLEESGIIEDLERTRARNRSLEMQEEKLRAFIEEREPDFSNLTDTTEEMIKDQTAFFEGMRLARSKESSILQNQLGEKRQAINALHIQLRTAQQNYSILQEIYGKRLQLAEKGYVSKIQILDTKQQVNALTGEIQRIKNQLEVANTEITQFENRFISLGAKHRDEAYEKLSAIASEKEQNDEMMQKLEDRIKRLELRSPTEGVIKGLKLNTIGAVVQAGETLLEIVPLGDKLEVSVKIAPQDIGHIKLGQDVQVKVSSYDFSRYGFIKGKISQISASTFADENGGRYYQANINLDKNYVGDNPNNVVLAGMTVMADVITGEKTILQYLLKPIHLSLQNAFSER
jgi:HlyD family secretion protein/adhesin transport system membrane fusion protein